MTDKNRDFDMARPSDQALAVPVEPANSLDPSGFDPSRIYVIIRSTGEYSDRCETVVGFVRTEGEARAVVTQADAEASAASATKPASPAWDGPEADWDAYEAKVTLWLDTMRAQMEIDPDGIDEYEDRPSYFYSAANAIAIETRQGGDSEAAPSSDESAAIAQTEVPNDRT